jgi:uncharacterized protein involved in cysteine biosynthesis
MIILQYRTELAQWIFGEGALGFTSWGVVFLGLVAATLVALVTSLVSAELLLDPFLERARSAMGLSKDGEVSLAQILWVIFPLRLLLLLGLGALALLSFVIPPLHFISWSLGAFYLGTELLHTPAVALGIPIRQQQRLIRENLFQTFLLGGLFSIPLLIPLAGLFLLPFAYVTGLRVVSELSKQPSTLTSPEVKSLV